MKLVSRGQKSRREAQEGGWILTLTPRAIGMVMKLGLGWELNRVTSLRRRDSSREVTVLGQWLDLSKLDKHPLSHRLLHMS